VIWHLQDLTAWFLGQKLIKQALTWFIIDENMLFCAWK
jgi:hypothetical protein